jgi:hypothetical protein
VMNCQRGLESERSVTFVDRPNICRLIWQNRISDDGKVLSVAISDFANNATASLASSSAQRFMAAIRRGIADTLCEDLAVGRMSRQADGGIVHNTADVFDRAGASAWIVLRDPSDAALANIPLSRDVRQRVVDDLVAHNLVLIPKQAIDGRIGWWRIDPRSGRTIGVMDNGLCSDDVEYADTQIPEEGMEGTLTTRGPQNPRIKDWGNLAQQIVKFRQPGGWDEFFKCWEEAYEIVFKEPWTNPP